MKTYYGHQLMQILLTGVLHVSLRCCMIRNPHVRAASYPERQSTANAENVDPVSWGKALSPQEGRILL